MRPTARMAALGAVVVTVVSLVAPVTSASAGTSGVIIGGCGVATVNNAALTNGTNVGVIFDASIT